MKKTTLLFAMVLLMTLTIVSCSSGKIGCYYGVTPSGQLLQGTDAFDDSCAP